MPRENSISDSDGRSLTPDLEEETGIAPTSPTYGGHAHRTPFGSHIAHVLSSKKSLHSHLSRVQTRQSAIQTRSPWQNLTPKDQFRAAVRKVMAMRRGTTILGGARQIGDEPGIDPRRPSADITYGQIHANCRIEVVDYSAVRCNSRTMSNEEFVDFLGNEATWKPEPWTKVRWINIGGVSWDVIKALALRYKLHPLALEDVFHGHARNRSKADYYTKHLFLRILCHELQDEASSHSEGMFVGQHRSASPEPMGNGVDDIADPEGDGRDDDKTLDVTTYVKSRSSTLRRRPLLPSFLADLPKPKEGTHSRLASLLKREHDVRAVREERGAAEVSLDVLKKGERVNVKVTPMFIFLFRDGTVISLHQTPNLDFSAPISRRLRQRDTVLRKSIDPSLLVHALLDLTVDKALRVIDEYHTKIMQFERKILLRPNMKTVRELHILSGDLILHKRTLDPIKTMIFGLRRYDLDRCAALVDMSDPANADVKIVGYMSHKAKIYLADVHDHTDYILTSLDMFAGVSQNLIDYTFNVASYQMNEVMRRLTLATIIFLPLTLLTGYFGMNFEHMWSVQGRSDVLFWEIALPVMAVVVPWFLLSDIKQMFHYVQKRIASSRAVKAYKTA